MARVTSLILKETVVINIHAHLYGGKKGILQATQKITQAVYQRPYKLWYLRPDTATRRRRLVT